MDLSLLINKLLPLFVMPVGTTCVLMTLALFLMLLGIRRTAFVISALAMLILTAASMPITAQWLGKPLEQMYPVLVAKQAPAADAIVVLGGGVELPIPPRQKPEFNGAGDRIVEGARLYRAGRAPVMLLTGGNVYGQRAMQGESVYAAELVAMLGVDPAAVVVESASRSTYENAIESRRYLRKKGIRRVLLVTSAAHMPRAVATFNSAGIDVVAAPVDFTFTEWGLPTLMKYFPDSRALTHTSKMLHEYIGFFVYRWRGWISDQYSFRPEPSTSVLALSQSDSS